MSDDTTDVDDDDDEDDEDGEFHHSRTQELTAVELPTGNDDDELDETAHAADDDDDAADDPADDDDYELRPGPVVVEVGERPYECLEIHTPLHEFEAFATARLEALARLGEADRAEIAKGALELGRIALRQAMGGAKETL